MSYFSHITAWLPSALAVLFLVAIPLYLAPAADSTPYDTGALKSPSIVDAAIATSGMLGTWGFQDTNRGTAPAAAWLELKSDAVAPFEPLPMDDDEKPERPPSGLCSGYSSSPQTEEGGSTARKKAEKEKPAKPMCMVWAARQEGQRRGGYAPVPKAPEGSDEGGAALSTPVGVVSLRVRVDAGDTLHGADAVVLRGAAWRSTYLSALFASFQFRGLPETAPESVWNVFGFGRGSSRQLRRYYNLKGFQGNALLLKYFWSGLSSSEAVRLFAAVYQYQRQYSDEKHTVKPTVEQPIGSDGGTRKVPIESMDVWDAHCFWLLQLPRLQQGDSANPAVVVEGRLISTCGDYLVLQADSTRYAAQLKRVHMLFLLLIPLVGLPLVWGAAAQAVWIHNSRGRALRVNRVQLVLLIAWSGLCMNLLVLLADPLLGASYALIQNTVLLYYVIVFGTALTVWRAHATGDTSQARNRLPLGVVIIVALAHIAGRALADNLSADLDYPWLAVAVSLCFWLPQLVHAVVHNAWTGLTPSFLVAGALLAVVPMVVAALGASDPWVTPVYSRTVLLGCAAIVTIQTAFLIVIRITDAKNLLPAWMAPWRHRYCTTVERHRAELAENAACPICQNTLTEGWDDHDELWVTPCSHLFHQSCLSRWMEERMECPLCRVPLPDP